MLDKPAHHHRRSIRLKDYDYSSPGAYFITVVTCGHKCIFGKIINQEMILNDLGTIVRDCLLEIPCHFLDVEVDPFVVMPNHIHIIITIHENDRRGTIYRAPTENYSAPKTEKFGQPVPGSIPTIIRTYKAVVTRRAKLELGMTKIWQRNYYEHILRDQPDLDATSSYIISNPLTWHADPEFKPYHEWSLA